jgi:hypothetical protein
MKLLSSNILFLLLLASSASFVLRADTGEISNLSCVYSGGLVKISWQSGAEQNVKEYMVEKSSDGSVYYKLSSELPKGSMSSYTVFDSNPHSKTEIYYRVVTVFYNGDKLASDGISVKINTAGISATWGSIKALFR